MSAGPAGRKIAIWAVALVFAALSSGCAAGGRPQATFRVWRTDCSALIAYTRAQVGQAWGEAAISHDVLSGEPAAVNARCEAQRRREPGP